MTKAPSTVNHQPEQCFHEAQVMARSNEINPMRTIRKLERRLSVMGDSARRAAATIPTALTVLVVLASLFLAFVQLLRQH